MSRYYVNERARYGGVTGTIIPFPQQLPAGNDPSTGNWRSYLPSGYLRCDGSVYNKDLYPVLAQVLGLGDNSKFLKLFIISTIIFFDSNFFCYVLRKKCQTSVIKIQKFAENLPVLKIGWPIFLPQRIFVVI